MCPEDCCLPGAGRPAAVASGRRLGPGGRGVAGSDRQGPRAATTILFTGFPGFIGLRLLPRLLELKPDARIACLVQEKFLGLARDGVTAIEKAHPHAKGRLDLVTGDITRPGLGLDETAAARLRRDLTECYHLAAVYDLAVSAEVGHRINVEGTRHVLDFLGEAKRFARLHYVSTAYVSGTAKGPYRETDLDVGQGWKNHYERTKFEAEVLVAKSSLPKTIYRPGIVVGDSRTGETGKFDGPYFILRFMERLPSPGLFALPGGGRGTANLVPVDFVIEAMARLAASPKSLGKTYHLTDPDPLSPAADRPALREDPRQELRVRARAHGGGESGLPAHPPVAGHAHGVARLLQRPGPPRCDAGHPGPSGDGPHLSAAARLRAGPRRLLSRRA